MAEVIAMVLILFYFETLPYYLKTLIDASIMIVLIYPLIYFLSFRPLLLHIEKSRKAEEKLREMALFPALNPDAVLQVDGSGRIVGSNPSADRMDSVGTQLSNSYPIFKTWIYLTVVAGTTQHVHEARLGERVLLWTIRGATDLGLAFLYSQDITERKRSEETIRLLSSVVEQTADTVVVTDCDGVIEYVNPALENATGYTKEEVLGKTPRILKSGVHNDQFYSELWRTILRGETFHGEITNCKKNGVIIHESKTITPLRDAYGVITHFVATGKDITDRKQAEEKLLKAYDELELRVQKRTEELVVANTN
jgi:PAS domain S-box-containing protein